MYGKIFDSIFDSSIMEEDIEIRYVWMCMLAAADREGFVDATIPSLARKFNIPEEVMGKAIEAFLAPDPTSRTPDNEGRRIEPIRDSFGWRIINYEKYREMKRNDDRREYMRKYMQDYRSKQKGLQEVNGKQLLGTLADTDADTSSDSDTDIEKDPPPSAVPFFSDQQLNQTEKLCKTLQTYFKKNFWPWIEECKKSGCRSEMVIDILSRLWDNHKDVKDPWPWLNHVMSVEHQNKNEAEGIALHEQRKKEELDFEGIVDNLKG